MLAREVFRSSVRGYRLPGYNGIPKRAVGKKRPVQKVSASTGFLNRRYRYSRKYKVYTSRVTGQPGNSGSGYAGSGCFVHESDRSNAEIPRTDSCLYFEVYPPAKSMTHMLPYTWCAPDLTPMSLKLLFRKFFLWPRELTPSSMSRVMTMFLALLMP